MTTQTTAVVIGAGPAASARLGRAGVDQIVLERGPQVAPQWRMHDERLHLHTYRNLSNNRFKEWDRGIPAYPSGQQAVDHMGGYAGRFGVSPLFGQDVRNAERVDGHWRVETQGCVFVVGQVLARLPVRLADTLVSMSSKLEFGDLSGFGITRPELGPISQIRQLGRVPDKIAGTEGRTP